MHVTLVFRLILNQLYTIQEQRVVCLFGHTTYHTTALRGNSDWQDAFRYRMWVLWTHQFASLAQGLYHGVDSNLYSLNLMQKIWFSCKDKATHLDWNGIDMFIAIIGTRAAGKTSVKKYLEAKGFRHVRVSGSDEVRAFGRRLGRAHL
jgi:hypothetical protein